GQNRPAVKATLCVRTRQKIRGLLAGSPAREEEAYRILGGNPRYRSVMSIAAADAWYGVALPNEPYSSGTQSSCLIQQMHRGLFSPFRIGYRRISAIHTSFLTGEPKIICHRSV